MVPTNHPSSKGPGNGPSKGPRTSTSNTQPVRLTKAPSHHQSTRLVKLKARAIAFKTKHTTEMKKSKAPLVIKKGGWAPLKSTSSMKKSRATSSPMLMTKARAPVKPTNAKYSAPPMGPPVKLGVKAKLPSVIITNISSFTSRSPKNTDVARVMCACGSKDGRPSWGGKCALCRPPYSSYSRIVSED